MNEIAEGEYGKRENCYTYRHEVVTSSKSFDFTVKAANECGECQSLARIIKVAGTPGCPTCVLAGGDCDVSLTWLQPENDGGSPIDKYDVKILSANGDYVSV